MVTAKQRAGGAVLAAIGVAALLWQIKILKEEYYFYKIGMICGLLIVFGIAFILMGTDGLMDKDENGKSEAVGFWDLPFRWKLTMALAVLASLAQYIYFDLGAPGLL